MDNELSRFPTLFNRHLLEVISVHFVQQTSQHKNLSNFNPRRPYNDTQNRKSFQQSSIYPYHIFSSVLRWGRARNWPILNQTPVSNRESASKPLFGSRWLLNALHVRPRPKLCQMCQNSSSACHQTNQINKSSSLRIVRIHQKPILILV